MSKLALGNAPQGFTFFPTPLPSLNVAIGNMNGIRSKGILQIIAHEKCGKTTLSYHIIAASQKAKKLETISFKYEGVTIAGNAVFLDIERQFDAEYAEQCGVDTSKLIILRPDDAEEMMFMVESMLKLGFKLIIWDSIPATITRDEFNKDITDAEKMAGSANLISRWLKRIIGMIYNADALLIGINQLRANISPMARSDSKPYGPRALRYYSTLIFDMARVKNEEGVAEVRVTISKNKQGAEGHQTTLYLVHGKGFDISRDIIELALQFGIVKKGGAWYTYGEAKAQGINQCKEKFDMEQLTAEVIKAIQ